MERYTCKDGQQVSLDRRYVRDEGGALSGEAVDRLARFEDFLFDTLNDQDALLLELEALREEDKTKTVRYRETFTRKLLNNNTLMILRRYGLIEDEKEKTL